MAGPHRPHGSLNASPPASVQASLPPAGAAPSVGSPPFPRVRHLPGAPSLLPPVTAVGIRGSATVTTVFRSPWAPPRARISSAARPSRPGPDTHPVHLLEGAGTPHFSPHDLAALLEPHRTCPGREAEPSKRRGRPPCNVLAKPVVGKGKPIAREDLGFKPDHDTHRVFNRRSGNVLAGTALEAIEHRARRCGWTWWRWIRPTLAGAGATRDDGASRGPVGTSGVQDEAPSQARGKGPGGHVRAVVRNCNASRRRSGPTGCRVRTPSPGAGPPAGPRPPPVCRALLAGQQHIRRRT